MKRRQSSEPPNKKAAPACFPLAAMLPEMQAEVLTHLSLQDLFSGTSLVSRTLHALTHKEVQRRLAHEVFRDLPREVGSGSGWDRYFAGTGRFFDDRCWVRLRRQLIASVSWRSRESWQRLSLQCFWIRTLWLAQAVMIHATFLEGVGKVRLRAFCGTREYWYIEKDSREFGALVAVGSPALRRQYRRVDNALRRINHIFEDVRYWRETSDIDDDCRAEGMDEAAGRLSAAFDNLFQASFMELDLGLTLSCNGWHMGRSTLWQVVPSDAAKPV
jgi:hypothetical protein